MKMDDDNYSASPPSLKTKLKQSLCFSCCFRRRHRHRHRHGQHLQLHSPLSTSDDNPALIWVKTEGPHEQSLSEIKEKCRIILGLSKHKKHSSAEFRYDPLSYALNFEDGFCFDDEAPLRSFSARLPPSPPVPAAVN